MPRPVPIANVNRPRPRPKPKLPLPGSVGVSITNPNVRVATGILPPSAPPSFQAPPPPEPPPPPPPPEPRVWAPDSIYSDQTAYNERAYQDALTDIGTDERNVEYQFGYNDPTNPFNRVNELKRDFLSRGRGVTNALAARGQLFSGAHQRGLANNLRAEAEANAALRQQYDALIEDLKRRTRAAGTAREEANLNALNDSKTRQGLS